MKKPILLCILDGVGMRKESHGNAFLSANTPNFDRLMAEYPHSLLEASGEAVGLPRGQMGNSEVGHLNIGAGRIVYQPLQFIHEQIENGEFFQNTVFLDLIRKIKKRGTNLHLLGLLSDGGVHSHIDQLMALLDLCVKEEMNNVFVHVFTDGRDTLPTNSLTYLTVLQTKLDEIGFGSIATISGRYYAMDRDNRYDRVHLAYQAMTEGIGEHCSSFKEAINSQSQKGVTDEFIVPTILNEQGLIKANDGLLCFNYRPDRLRELFSAFTNPQFKGFDRELIPDLSLVTMMSVSDEVIHQAAFSLSLLTNTLGEYLASAGISQLRIAETEKYAHVTYFFDGGLEKKLDFCRRILIPSPLVATYDLQPEMSALKITEALLKELDQDCPEVIILNFANGDMLGHTGKMKETIYSIEVMDQCLGVIAEKIKLLGGVMIVTADHGNCEFMIDDMGQTITSHTISQVPFMITDKSIQLTCGKLGDIAPTILELLDLKIPKEMTGTSLIKK